MTTILILAVLGNSRIEPQMPLFRGTGTYSRKVTNHAIAQKYFDQGLNMLYAFHHGESKRSFREAIRLDPKCAMAYWGLATANGPHVNFPIVPPDEEKEAFDAIQMALKLKARNSGDADLIRAASKRFKWPQLANREPLDKAYADAMRSVYSKHPNDPDAASLFAESMMDLTPWDYWKKDKTPKPGTTELIASIRKALAVSPNHPMALHLYVHAMEASARPQLAVAAADRLRFLQPGLGHNVHMPSHIDVRVGAWQKSIDANARAMVVDANYRAENKVAPLYRVYMAHNNHMLAFSAMMNGQRELALKSIDAMVAAVPEDFQQEMAPFVDGFFAMPTEVRVRFGMWDEVLAMPELPERFPLSRAMRFSSRAVAYAAKKMPVEARAEQALFLAASKAVPESLTFGNNKASDLLNVATLLTEGEILVAEGEINKAVETLQKGAQAEGQLRYSEPPDWIQPVRHPLGALLLREGRFAEAEKVFWEDLKNLPKNGWSLYGLTKSFEGQGKQGDAKVAQSKFQKVWAKADTKITSSCLCIPGK
jgi:tetratricopeptide (TPR) repeat protein